MMEKVPWIFWMGPKCNHSVLKKREAQEELTIEGER